MEGMMNVLMRHVFLNYILHGFAILFGLCVVIAHVVSNQLSWFLGKVGEGLVVVGTFFPLWLGILLLCYGWFLLGVNLFRLACVRASGTRGFIFNPEWTLVGVLPWIGAWPVLAPIEFFLVDHG